MNMKTTNPCIECDTNWCRAQSEGKKCPAMFYVKPRPHGKWLYVHPLQEDDGGAYMCSVCRTGDWNIRGDENFCPNCGSDNRKRGEAK